MFHESGGVQPSITTGGDEANAEFNKLPENTYSQTAPAALTQQLSTQAKVSRYLFSI
jgi:hypothetical protein